MNSSHVMFLATFTIPMLLFMTLHVIPGTWPQCSMFSPQKDSMHPPPKCSFEDVLFMLVHAMLMFTPLFAHLYYVRLALQKVK